MVQLGFVGAGNMAGAILTGLLDKKIYTPPQVAIFDTDEEKRARFSAAGHPVMDSVEQLVQSCRMIVLAIKPQIFPKVMPSLRASMSGEKVLVSIAAGIGGAYIQEGVGFPCKLILAMPNTPLMLGAGATALSRVGPATPEDFAQVRDIFAASGVVEEISPDKMNAVIGVSGSMPAFLYLLAKTVVGCAEGAGIDPEAANRLLCQTLVGSAKMMTESGKTHQELIDMVCSPGGTTLAGLEQLDKSGFAPAIENAFAACIRRAEELSL